MAPNQVFPQEILNIIIQHTFLPWPAHPGRLYDNALDSRRKSPFLSVNTLCRQAIYDELFQMLWLDFKWFEPRLQFDSVYQVRMPFTLFPPPGRTMVTPTLTFVVRRENHELAPYSELTGVPFNYYALNSMFHRSFYRLAQDKDTVCYIVASQVTSQTTRLVDQQIQPLLKLLLTVRPASYPWTSLATAVRVQRRIDSDQNPTYFDLLGSAIFAYQEFRKLKSQCLHAEAGVFGFLAEEVLFDRYVKHFRRTGALDTYEDVLDSDWIAEAFSNPNQRPNELHMCMMQFRKIMLEFTILANSAFARLLHSDPVWAVEHEPTLPWSSSFCAPHERFLGFSDIDMASWYHSYGLAFFRETASLALHNLGWSPVSPETVEIGKLYLALAMAMFPDNESWKQEIKASTNLTRQLHNGILEDPIDLAPPRKQKYLDSEGNWREWVGDVQIDDLWAPNFKYLPQLQRFSSSCVAELAQRLGIENGEWRWVVHVSSMRV